MAGKRRGTREGGPVLTTVPASALQGDNPVAPLTLDRILDCAIALLDADGLGALTMRRLADSLNAGVMSLYWHVENKERLLDLALDAALAEPGRPAATEPGTWRDDIGRILADWRGTMLRHPWSVSLLPGRALGPNTLDRLERLAVLLGRAGVADADLNPALWSLWNYVMGATMTRVNFARPDETGPTAVRPRLVAHDAYPTLARTRLLDDEDWDGTFEKGLQRLLDGLIAKA